MAAGRYATRPRRTTTTCPALVTSSPRLSSPPHCRMTASL